MGQSILTAMAWIGLIFVGPAIFGTVLGVSTQRGWGRAALLWLFKKIRVPVNVVHQVPTAWDWKFNGMASGEWVFVILKDETKFAGWFGGGSFAGSDAKDHDIYIQSVFNVSDANEWTPRNSAVLIAASEIRTVEFFPASTPELTK